MKKKIIRILCGILCGALAFTSTAFAKDDTSKPSEEKSEQKTEATEEKKGLRYDAESEYKVYAGYTPDYSGYASSQFDFFMDVLKLYVDTHLFEFDEDQVTEAFLMKLMKENPELMNLFIDTLLTTMDPFSGYYEAGKGLAGDGSTSGYGIVMASEENGNIKAMGHTVPGLYVCEVIKDSPADKAGVRAGDRVVSVEGTPLEGLSYDAAVYLIRYMPYIEKEVFDAMGNSLGIPNEPEFEIIDEKTGKKAYYIHLELERNGEIIPVKMIKGRVIYSNITYEKVANKTYSKITIASFEGEKDIEDFRAALDRAIKDGTGNLLIDLRNNTGGKLGAALAMANMLIPEKDKVLFYYNSRDLEKPEVVLSEGGGHKFDKITILVNGYSASASEMLAMTLQYNCGATIIGTKTYGKAVGQQGYYMANGDMFTITSMEILDPLKRSYHNEGLVPDVEIDICLDKYIFPNEVGELMFIPDAEYVQESADNAAQTENSEQIAEAGATEISDAEEITPVMTLKEGESSENISALEKRLWILGFLREEKVDGVADKATISAVKAFETYIYGKPEGTLDEREVKLINSMSEKYRNHYFEYDSQLEVAEMSFSSTSQARRRAKELKKESDKVNKDYEAYRKAEEERIKAEEAAAEAAAEAEAEAESNAESNEQSEKAPEEK